MPVYEYLCEGCGRDFALMRPMAQSGQPQACPGCGGEAHRALLSAPAVAGMAAGQRRAHAINERSAHEPKSSAQSGHRHGPGCGCASAVSPATVRAGDGSKHFPSKRPWMISH